MSILIIASHPDDEILGCGGTMSKFSNEGHEVNVIFVADGETSRPLKKNIKKKKIQKRYLNAKIANKIVGTNKLFFFSFPDNQLDTVSRLKITKRIEEVVVKMRPSIVFTHSNSDVNIDHRIVHECVLAACRPKPNFSVNKLFFFEVPSSTEWNTCNSFSTFTPNYFFDISKTIKNKLKALEAYDDEMMDFPHPRSLKAVKSLSEWRGASAGLNSAEAFVTGRIIKK